MSGRPQSALGPLAVSAVDAARLMGISRSQFFKLHASGRVPAPVNLGARAPRWRLAELSDWLESGCPDRKAWERIRGVRELRDGST